MEETCLVLCTVPDEEAGVRIGHALLDSRLAACVSLVPGLRSLYRWKEEICDEREVLLLIKTRTHLWETLLPELRSLHPYEVPEILRFPASAGLEAYLEWVGQSVRPEESRQEQRRREVPPDQRAT